jgi:hypothetical protein
VIAIVAHLSNHPTETLSARLKQKTENKRTFNETEQPVLPQRCSFVGCDLFETDDTEPWPEALDDTEQWRRLQLAWLRAMVDTLRENDATSVGSFNGTLTELARNEALLDSLAGTLAKASALTIGAEPSMNALIAWYRPV